MTRSRLDFLIAVLLILAVTVGCGRRRSDRIVATVNNYKMTVEDFEYESKEIFRMGRVIGDVPNTKEEILDALIVKEILLQEAQKQELDKDKEFMRSIELYWEQTLIKNLMKKKFKEIHDKVAVYEEEILEYYRYELRDKESPFEDVRNMITREIRSKKERKLLDEWIDEMRSKSRIKVNKGVLNEL